LSRWGIFIAVAVIIGGVLLVGGRMSPANQPGASDAFNACEVAIISEVPNAVLPAAGDVLYSGSEAAWTITGTYHIVGDTQQIAWTCLATKVSAGNYSATWQPQ